jgi:general secretion pathway protein N
MSWGKKIILGLALLLVIIGIGVLTLPARVAAGWLVQAKPELSLEQVDGTWWRGQAERVRVRGIAIGQLSWQLQLSSLLLLSPVVDLQLRDATSQLAAEVTRHASGAVSVANLQADVDAAWLAPALGIPMLRPTGRLRADLAELAVASNGLPERARGQLRWEDAGVTGMAQAQFGGLQLDLNTTDRIKGTIRPLGNKPALEATGQFELQGVNYQAEVRLAPNTDNPQLSRALQWVGEPLVGDAVAGARLLKIEGRLLLGPVP